MIKDTVTFGAASVNFTCTQDSDGKWVQSQTFGSVQGPDAVRTKNLLAPDGLLEGRFDSKEACMAALKAEAEKWAMANG